MQCSVWDKRLTEENRPRIYSDNPFSPYSYPSEPYSLGALKYKGLVQTSCVPIIPDLQLAEVPTNDDLVIKLTPTGVLWIHERRFKKRYTGSTACAVDINGRLWLDGKELDHEVKKRNKPKYKKKSTGVQPDAQKCFNIINSNGISESLPGAISENLTIPENFSTDCDKNAPNVAKKQRKKSYSIDKAKCRSRILAMTNTKKGKKELYFWTVSFPEHTPDDVCYQAFNTWLTTLRQRKMLRDYLWVAERQTGERLKTDKAPTNTIHFHIAIPRYMNAQRANNMMRGTLKNLAKRGLMPGAVCGKNGDNYFLPCIARYNGVDICKHKKTKRVINFAVKKGSVALSNYLTKYITKNDSEFSHLAWHNSRGFSCLFTGVTYTLNEFKKVGFGFFLNRVRVFRMNFATFVPWLYGPPPLLMEHLYKLNSLIQTLNDNE